MPSGGTSGLAPAGLGGVLWIRYGGWLWGRALRARLGRLAAASRLWWERRVVGRYGTTGRFRLAEDPDLG